MCQDSSQICAPQRRKYRLHITKIQKHKYTVHITKFQNTSAQFYITKLHKYTSAESPVGKGNLDVNVSSLLPDRRSLKTEETTLTDVLPQCISTFTINAQIQMKLQKYEYKGAETNLQNYRCTTSKCVQIQVLKYTIQMFKFTDTNVQEHKYKCSNTQRQMFKLTHTHEYIHKYKCTNTQRQTVLPDAIRLTYVVPTRWPRSPSQCGHKRDPPSTSLRRCN